MLFLPTPRAWLFCGHNNDVRAMSLINSVHQCVSCTRGFFPGRRASHFYRSIVTLDEKNGTRLSWMKLVSKDDTVVIGVCSVVKSSGPCFGKHQRILYIHAFFSLSMLDKDPQGSSHLQQPHATTRWRMVHVWLQFCNDGQLTAS